MSDNILELIEECKSNQRSAQAALYQKYYGYAMSICLPYSKDRSEAEEIAHDGFLKVFTKIAQYDSDFQFKSWIRRIFVNSAIDYFRRNKKHYLSQDIDEAKDVEHMNDNIIDVLSAEEILTLVRQLSPQYQMVFNLYVLEGYKHNEIAEMMGITQVTSWSNLAKARQKLKEAMRQFVKL